MKKKTRNFIVGMFKIYKHSIEAVVNPIVHGASEVALKLPPPSPPPLLLAETQTTKAVDLKSWHTYKVAYCHLIYGKKKIPGNCQFLLMSPLFSCQSGKNLQLLLYFSIVYKFLSNSYNLVISLKLD